MEKSELAGVMVCGVCPHPIYCYDKDRCSRATDLDYNKNKYRKTD